MEYGQPWVPQRPSARPGVGFRPNPPIGSQRIQQPNGTGQNGISTLSREERQEAKRLAEEANFSFAGYQVVRREFISHRFDPAMTIRGNSITFNNSCISKLEDAKKNVGSYGFNLHMCFQGNPGTGKTEVARILSRILYSAGVLPEAKLVETDSTGLLGRFVGETGPKTQRKIQEAMGGVLFIDEAYALCAGSNVSGASRNYGDEAIAVLLKEIKTAK